MTIRVLLLTQWCDPEPTFKGLLFARELVQQGFDVEIVTGFPNYPGGKLYPGYSVKWLQRELIDGVRITRVPLYPSHDQSAFKRVLNYVSFAASAAIYGIFMAKRASVLYAYHPPLTVGIAAVLIKFFRRIPVVYDIQDVWPDTLRATGMLSNSRALSAVAAVCRWVYRRVDRIVVLSPGFRHLLLERGVPKCKLEIIYNWADEVALMAPQRIQANTAAPDNIVPHPFWGRREEFRACAEGFFTILFAGNMGKAQALDAVLDAALLLQQRGARLYWIMLGGGVEMPRLKRRAANMQLTNVMFLPPVSMSEVGAYLSAADALLVHLRKDPLFEITIPSKTQAYMAVGKPLLMAVDGDAADLVRRSGGGLVAESENPQALADAAECMATLSADELASMGRKAQMYYQQHLALAVGVRRFGAIFSSISRSR